MNTMAPLAAGFIAVAVILILREKGRQKRIEQEYDEMQVRIRGKGKWYAFYTMVLFMGVYMVLEAGTGFSLLSPAKALFLSCMVSGSVNVGYTILHDSYYGMNWRSSRSVVFLSLIGVLEVTGIVLLVKLASAGAFKDLTRTIEDERIMIVLCLPLFTTILVTTLIRRLRPAEEED